MPDQLFRRGYTEKMTTKRGTTTGVRRTAPVAYLSNIRCSPVLPLDPTALQEAVGRGVSIERQVFSDPADIIPEDRIQIVDDTQEYVVIEVARWPVTDTRALHITLRAYQGD